MTTWLYRAGRCVGLQTPKGTILANLGPEQAFFWVRPAPMPPTAKPAAAPPAVPRIALARQAQPLPTARLQLELL